MRVAETLDVQTCQDIRRAVFVAEQNVPLEEEIDGKDADCRHYLFWKNEAPVGTLRVATLDDGTAKIQRVALLSSARGKGGGAYLMREVMAMLAAQGVHRVTLGAQVTALGFYERLGFVAHGPEFDDAGIPHRQMSRDL